MQSADQQDLRAMKSEQRPQDMAQALAITRATLESTTDGILVTDASDTVVDLNENFLLMWNISRQELLQASLLEAQIFVSFHFHEPKKYLARVAEIGDSRSDSFDLLKTNDRRIFERYSRVLLANDECIGRVWSFRDVTARHAAEFTSRWLAAIVASSDDAIIGKDLNSTITSWNQGAERIFGYTAGEMIGRSVMDLIPEDRRGEEMEILARIRRGERIDHFETVRLARGERRLDVSIAISPIKDASGKVIGASKVARDITERKKMDAALEAAMLEAERANRLKDEFLATLSHELRTPLHALLGWTVVLRNRESIEPEEIRQGLDTIERNARMQLKIVQDLLDMSGILSGKLELVRQEINLSNALCEAVDSLHVVAEEHNVRVDADIAPFAGPVLADPIRLQQIFWNLLHNAIKFSPRGGRVHVILDILGSEVEVRVVDSGEGIDPGFLPHVFDRFQQADASSSRRHGGLGLGLAIVRQLVDLHGGSIFVKSDGRGQGSTFLVRFPVVGGFSELNDIRNHFKAAGECSFSSEPNLGDVHILVVDDEVDGCLYVKEVLEDVGARVSLASNARDAMSFLQVDPPGLILCDIGLPGEDGYSFIRRLRALGQSEFSDIPAVALTANVFDEDRSKAIQTGFQEHLPKPVEPGELLAAVRKLICRNGSRSPAP